MSTGNNGELTFIEESHQYFVDDVELLPVTTFIKKFFTTFDETKVAAQVASKTGTTVANLLKDWGFKRDIACAHGTLVHKEIEELLINKKHAQLLLDVVNPKSRKAYEWLISTPEFSNAVRVMPEEKIYSTQYRVAGTIDLLLQQPNNEVVLIDWKTNNKPTLSTYSFGKKGLGACKNIDDAKYYHYELQLSTYAFLLKKEYGYKIKKLLLVHLNDKDELKVHQVKYRKVIVGKMFKEFLQ